MVGIASSMFCLLNQARHHKESGLKLDLQCGYHRRLVRIGDVESRPQLQLWRTSYGSGRFGQ